MSETMKAWVTRVRLPPSQGGIVLEEDYPKPVPKGSQLLIKVKAVALNAGGWKTIYLKPFCYIAKRPGTCEPEFTGVIEGGQLAGSGWDLGDEVYGANTTWFLSGNGALAQYVLTDPDKLARKPRSMSFEEAATLPVALLTPYWSLVTIGGLVKGDGKRIFINGGSGGVGFGAIQIAKAYGAYVVSTCSPESEALVRSLGADEVIDYRSVDLIPYLSEKYTGRLSFDILCDNVGNPELFLHSASGSYLKPDGMYINVGGGAFNGWKDTGWFLWQLLKCTCVPVFLGGVPRKYRFIQTPPGRVGEAMRAAAQLIDEGKFKGVIDSEYEFEDAVKAYDRIISNRAKGKVVIKVP
ncbi:NAD(P)-binding protein [Meredithblackwellia eburnea MCA 4105]